MTDATADGAERAGSLVNDPAEPRIVDFVALADPAERRARERNELFVVEGLVAVSRLVDSGHRIRSVLTNPKWSARVHDLLAGAGLHDVPVYVAPHHVLTATVGFNLHRGVVAAADRRPLPSVAELAGRTRRLAVLEGLNDPENLGLIARAARAFGIDGIVLDPTCIDPYYRRSGRVSMGDILLLPVARSNDGPADITHLHDAGFETWALTPAPDAEVLWDVDGPERVAVLLGAEGPGLSPAALSGADRRVRIPISPDVDSINVGHAAAVTFAAITRR
ncbi:RNA methyltransferase [soil metagenome]